MADSPSLTAPPSENPSTVAIGTSSSMATVASPLPTNSLEASACQTSTQSSHGAITSSAAVGIALGSAVAGAVVAVLLFLFVRPRYRKSEELSLRPQFRDSNTLSIVTTNTKSPNPAIAAIPNIIIPETSSAAIVQTYLPPPAADRTIESHFAKVRDKIAAHVQTYYRSVNVVHDLSSEKAIQEILGMEGMAFENLPTMVSDPVARDYILRAAIARMIIPKIDPESDPEESFLPVEIARPMYAAMFSKKDDPVRIAFLSKYRAVTSFLIGPIYKNESGISDSEKRGINIHQALDAADAVLRPFAEGNVDEEARRKDLEEAMKLAARFGCIMLSEPAWWKFSWQGRGLVVFPGLVQSADTEGRILSPPRVLRQTEDVRL